MLYLYVISYADPGPCKIGYAANPDRRLVAMQTGNHLELRIYSVWSCKHLTAPKLERHIHALLRPLRIRGEWYNTRPAEIAAILTNIPGVCEHTAETEQHEALRQATLYHPRFR